ncbi:substrate-binding periplasmic protein [Chitinimonas lacunae]|uniref:Substrate-binding periplasmic protein n=1 Tax=Chitinimonas lacunae TaxID=1963018 RepID=A0ABV8MT26_9NEIS
MGIRIIWGIAALYGGLAVAAAQEVPLATGEWPPYVMQKSPERAIFTLLVEEAFRRAGLKPVYRYTSWPRAEAMVEQGLVFAAFPYAHNEERARRFDFSSPVLISRSVLFYYRSHQHVPQRFERFSDFAGRQIATPRGYWYEDLLRRHGAQISYTSDEQSAFRLLMLGRAEAVVQDELVGWYLIGNHFPAQRSRFATFDTPVSAREQPLHLLVSRQYPGAAALKARLDSVIDEVRQSGMPEKLIAKFRLRSSRPDEAEANPEVGPQP